MSEMPPPEDDGIADGISHASKAAIKSGVTAAALAREQIARLQRDRDRQRQDQLEHQAGQHDTATEATLATVRADLAQVRDPAWWDHAAENPGAVGAAWDTAQQYRDLDPQIAELADHMQTEAERRWGIDLTHAGGVGAAAAARQQHEQQETHESQEQHVQHERDEHDALAGAALVGADQAHGSHETAAEAAAHDSDERRSQMATRAMNAGAEPTTAKNRVTASEAQAEPARAAVDPARQRRPHDVDKDRGRRQTRDRQHEPER